MPVFGYRVTDASGRVTEGVIEAAGERAATDRLREMNLVPIRVWTATAVAERRRERSLRGGNSLSDLRENAVYLAAAAMLAYMLVREELSRHGTRTFRIRAERREAARLLVGAAQPLQGEQAPRHQEPPVECPAADWDQFVHAAILSQEKGVTARKAVTPLRKEPMQTTEPPCRTHR